MQLCDGAYVTVGILSFIGSFDAVKTEQVVMIETQYWWDFGSENISSMRPWHGLVLHLGSTWTRKNYILLKRILTFDQTVSRCKEACKVTERVEVMDLAGKGGGGRTEREQESKMSSVWKEGQGQGCVGQGDLHGHI